MPDHKIEQEHENKSWEFGENRFPERRLSIFWLSDEWSDEQNKQAQEETEKTVLAHRLFAKGRTIPLGVAHSFIREPGMCHCPEG